MKNHSRIARRLLAGATLAFCSFNLFAATPANRIQTIGSGADGRSALAHSVSGKTKLATDLGPAPANRRMDGVTLFFSRTPAQQAALDHLLTAQQTPGSPQFHKWLTPAQFGAQFGLSQADAAKVSAWLTGQGLTVTGVSQSSTFLTVSGTVAQVQKAFGTSIHSVLLNGEQHIANVENPVLPTSVANVVAGVTGLTDFRLRSRARLQRVPAETAKPAFTSSLTGFHYLAPGDFNTIYDLKPLLAGAINGSTATIAVMGQTDISLSDVAAFRSAAGLSANAPTVLLNGVDPGTITGDLLEAQLDVEWSGAIAPNARIVYVNTGVNSGGVLQSLVYAVDHDTAPILSISYGLCEPLSDEADLYSYDLTLQQANSQGQTIVAPGGDAGATDCDTGIPAADGLAVDFPASSPHATAVGGLMFNEGSGTYWSTSNAADQSSALSYIPEAVWNETSSAVGLASGGGGASLFFNKPAWQVGSGVPGDFARDLPDIALSAASSHDGYLVCYQGSCTNGFRDANNNLVEVGGTSAGVPSFAGILAIVEQKSGNVSGVGNANPVIYGLAASSASSVFHDTNAGTNASPCAAGSPNCPSSGNLGYAAVAGYDLASGWGSVDATNLANAWSTATPTGASSTTGAAVSITNVNLASGAVTCGLTGTVTLNVSVVAADASSTAAPSGTVQLLVDGAVNGTAVALTNGVAVLSLDTAGLTSGGHMIAVVYSGDTLYASSKGNLAPTVSPSQVTYVPSLVDVVSSTQPDFALTPCLPSVATSSGAAAAGTTLTVTSANGFSGPVTFSVSSDASLAANYTFSAASVTVSPSAPGTTVLTLDGYQTSANALASPGDARGTTGGASRAQQLYGTGAGTVLAVLFLGFFPRRKRLGGLLVAIVAVGFVGLSGCGSGSSQIPASGGGGGGTGTGTTTTATTPGTYIVNVTATGTNSAGQPLVHTVSLTFTVN